MMLKEHSILPINHHVTIGSIMKRQTVKFLGIFVFIVTLHQTLFANETKLTSIQLKPNAIHSITLALNKHTEYRLQFKATEKLDFAGYVHPQSDIKEVNGNVNISCQGLDSHKVMKIGNFKTDVGEFALNTDQDIGIYTILIQNTNNTVTDLNYHHYTKSGQFILLDVQ